MKKHVYLVALLCGWMCAACSSAPTGKDGESSSPEAAAAAKQEPQAMQTSDVSVALTYGGKTYRSTVTRRPDKTLPVVTDEQGGQFFDNRIILHLTCEGKEVLRKDFTKQDFAPWTDARFLDNSILEGLVYNTTAGDGILYAASICYPQTDLYIPFSIRVTADGKYTIRREELLEDLFDETDSVR